jgi:heptosyltransferase-2
VLVIPETVDLLVGNPHIDNVIVYDKRGRERGLRAFFKLVSRLRKEHFGLAIVPHRSFRSALLVALSGIPQRIGFNTSVGAFLFTHRTFYRKDAHEIERNLDLLNDFGICLQDKSPEIFPSSQDRERITEFLRENGIQTWHDFVAVAPGSVWPTKCWPPERFTEVARLLFKKFGTMIVLIGGEVDRQLCQQIAKALPRGVGAVAAGHMSLRQSAALLERCTLLLSNDSAPVHLSVAMKTPVVAIFGPTVPAFGFTPWGEGHIVVQKQLKCRPCGIHGSKRCPRGHFQCMKGISPERVFREICRILQPRFGKH